MFSTDLNQPEWKSDTLMNEVIKSAYTDVLVAHNGDSICPSGQAIAYHIEEIEIGDRTKYRIERFFSPDGSLFRRLIGSQTKTDNIDEPWILEWPGVTDCVVERHDDMLIWNKTVFRRVDEMESIDVSSLVHVAQA